MIKLKLMVIAAITAVAIFENEAKATLVESGTATWYINGDSVDNPTPTTTVNWSVDFDDVANSGLYTYIYKFTMPGVVTIDAFEINIASSYISDIISSSITGNSPFTTGGTGTGLTSPYVYWDFLSPGSGSDTVSFETPDAPGLGSGSAHDGDIWSSGQLVAVPVPEASTIMAGALMLLPFGIGAIRSLRKERAV